MSGRPSERIRANAWAAAACFVAVMGTAVLANASEDGTGATKSASAKKQIKKLKQQLGTVEQRLAALEGSKPGGPPTGAAGGDLTGAYPNPAIADQIDYLRVGTGAGLPTFSGVELDGRGSFPGLAVYEDGTVNAELDTDGDLTVQLLLPREILLDEIASSFAGGQDNLGTVYVRQSATGFSQLVVEWDDSVDVIAAEQDAG